MQFNHKHQDEASNGEEYKKELENFLYLVSHDLNAPLRHVRQFSKLLLGKIEGYVGPEEQRYINFIERSITKSELMIEALLGYSRLNTRAMPWTEFDLDEVLHEALTTYEQQIQQYDIRIETAGLPEKYVADREQMRMVYEALIDNTIKFRDHNTIPSIEIRCVTDDHAHHFTYKDNGPGVDPLYGQSVFEMFKRGGAPEAIQGVGAGLAVVQKIIRRHGGEIVINYDKRGAGLTLEWSHPVFKAGSSLEKSEGSA